MDRSITIRESVDIARPPDAVWDYTQDYANRTAWDVGVEAVEILGADPRRVRLRLAGTGWVTIEYRLDRRPVRTSLAFTESDAGWLAGGGGSWDYEAIEHGTRWTQTNTLVFANRLVAMLLRPLARRRLAASTRTAMAAAKAVLEAEAPAA